MDYACIKARLWEKRRVHRLSSQSLLEISMERLRSSQIRSSKYVGEAGGLPYDITLRYYRTMVSLTSKVPQNTSLSRMM